MVDLVNIKNKRLEYPDAINQEFLTLEEYQVLTAKLVKVFAGMLKNKILKSEDAMSNITHEIMMADWRWDEKHLGTSSGKSFARSSYRIECAKYAIYSVVKRLKKNDGVGYFPTLTTGEAFEELIQDPCYSDPLAKMCENEATQKDKQLATDFLKSSLLSDKEEACLRLYYYKDKTYREIGETIGVCRERVRQIVEGALTKLRNNNETRLSERKERGIKSC